MKENNVTPGRISGQTRSMQLRDQLLIIIYFGMLTVAILEVTHGPVHVLFASNKMPDFNFIESQPGSSRDPVCFVRF
jgi:hypothetical protein